MAYGIQHWELRANTKRVYIRNKPGATVVMLYGQRTDWQAYDSRVEKG